MAKLGTNLASWLVMPKNRHTFQGIGGLHGLDGFDFLWVRLDARSINYVTKELNLALGKFILLHIKCDSSLLDSF